MSSPLGARRSAANAGFQIHDKVRACNIKKEKGKEKIAGWPHQWIFFEKIENKITGAHHQNENYIKLTLFLYSTLLLSSTVE